MFHPFEFLNIVVLGLLLLCAHVTGSISKEKGYSYWLGFVLGIPFHLLALLAIAILLPARPIKSVRDRLSHQERAIISRLGTEDPQALVDIFFSPSTTREQKAAIWKLRDGIVKTETVEVEGVETVETGKVVIDENGDYEVEYYDSPPEPITFFGLTIGYRASTHSTFYGNINNSHDSKQLSYHTGSYNSAGESQTLTEIRKVKRQHTTYITLGDLINKRFHEQPSQKIQSWIDKPPRNP